MLRECEWKRVGGGKCRGWEELWLWRVRVGLDGEKVWVGVGRRAGYVVDFGCRGMDNG